MWYIVVFLLWCECIRGAASSTDDEPCADIPWPREVIDAREHEERHELSRTHIAPIMSDSSLTVQNDLVNGIFSSYFLANDKDLEGSLKPHMSKIIASKRRSELVALSESISSEDSPNRRGLSVAIVSQAVRNAMEEQNRQFGQELQRARDSLPTVKVALITAVTNILTAIIAAGVALGVAFGATS